MLLRLALAHVEHLEGAIAALDRRVDEVIAPFASVKDGWTPSPVGKRAAETIIAEIGPDMGRFPIATHLASWAGVCPGNHESAGKHGSGGTRKGSKWLRVALVEAAHAAARTKASYLAAQDARLRGRRGPKKAALAVAHSILVIAWHLLTSGQPYTDLGADYFVRRQSHQAYRDPAGSTARAHGSQGHPGTNSGLTTSQMRAWSAAQGIFA